MKAESQPNGQGKRDPHPSRRRRKVLAALAGGLVLGLGAAATLAAWNDSELASRTFSAGGDVDIQGSTDGGVTWSSSSTAPGKTLSFSTDANKLVPYNEIIYAPFAVRLSPDSVTPPSGTLEGAVGSTITGFGPSGGRDWLLHSWAVYPDDASDRTCSAASVLTPAIRDGIWKNKQFGDRNFQRNFTLSKKPLHLCLAVAIAGTAPPRATGSVTWRFQIGRSTRYDY